MTKSSQFDLTSDEIYDVLSNSRRRYVLYYLSREQPVKISNLAESIAAWENETTVEELDTQQRKRVYVSLYQTHLPRLEDLGVISYDADSQLISVKTDLDQFIAVIGDEKLQTPWHKIILGFSGIGLLLIMGSLADISIMRSVDMLELSVLIVFCSLLASMVYLYQVKVGPPMSISIDDL